MTTKPKRKGAVAKPQQCPWCEEPTTVVMRYVSEREGFSVGCACCHSYGPVIFTKRAAIAAWNRIRVVKPCPPAASLTKAG